VGKGLGKGWVFDRVGRNGGLHLTSRVSAPTSSAAHLAPSRRVSALTSSATHLAPIRRVSAPTSSAPHLAPIHLNTPILTKVTAAQGLKLIMTTCQSIISLVQRSGGIPTNIATAWGGWVGGGGGVCLGWFHPLFELTSGF
jgi:hypothetical protein